MGLTIPAYAKLNLTLEVLGKRFDGYHELRSLMCSLALHDTLHLEPAPEIEVRCSLPELAGSGNLAHRAAVLLRAATGHSGGAVITIKKEIPVAAGLGGGSSDAAATLNALNRLWGTGLTGDALRTLAAHLGSDVPFCLAGGVALASGRGEKLHLLPPLPPMIVLLVRPPIQVSTASIYGALTPVGYGDGEMSERVAALMRAVPPAEWPLVNALQPVTIRAYPLVGEVLALLRDLGASPALMCGSGPTCFGLFKTTERAESGARAARERGWEAWVTSPLARSDGTG
jgi:4-diphosphocytidyl-2-C-methyl-D-erythritol kinase